MVIKQHVTILLDVAGALWFLLRFFEAGLSLLGTTKLTLRSSESEILESSKIPVRGPTSSEGRMIRSVESWSVGNDVLGQMRSNPSVALW